MSVNLSAPTLLMLPNPTYTGGGPESRKLVNSRGGRHSPGLQELIAGGVHPLPPVWRLGQDGGTLTVEYRF